MASKENTIDFTTSTPSESSASFGMSQSRAASTNLALDQVELRLDLEEIPAGPVNIVLHTTAGDAAELGLAVSVNGKDMDRCAVQSEHRLIIPPQQLEVGSNTIRLTKVPLLVRRISAVITDAPDPGEPSKTGEEPVPFGLREPA